MRKENVGRLLLTLLTAFVMLAGVFGAAVNTNISDFGNSPTHVAQSESEMKTREMGDALISANLAAKGELGTTDLTGIDNDNDVPFFKVDTPADIAVNEMREEAPQKDPALEAHGTRATAIDGGGPYGDELNPYYEGDSVNFEGTTVPAGDESSLWWRWDTDGDGVYEEDNFGDPAKQGDNTYTQDYTDNNIGTGIVEAWDGVSMTTNSGSGDIWDEAGIYWGLYQGYYATHGIEFKVHKDVTVDQLGMYRYSSYYPNYIYNLRLWTDTGVMLAQVLYPSVPYYSWRWFDIPPVDLTEGETYVVSVGVRYYMGGQDNPGLTPDGVIEPLNWVYAYYNQWAFPSSVYGSTPLPLVDFKYTWTEQVPDTMSDTFDIFVDNLDPYVTNARATSTLGYEGNEVGLQADFWDIGIDDTWEYRAVWGDGTSTPWKQVNKYSGGAKVLLYHSVAGYEDELYDSLKAAMGEYAVIFDMWSFYDDPGTLEMLLEYDVIIMPENTGIIGGWPPDVGDLLADYVDAGGNVVDMVATFYNGGTWGITGRWADEQYSCMQPGFIGGSQTTTAIYDPTHPIIDGPAGTVTSWGTSIPISSPGVRPDATLLADYPFYPAAAYKEAGTMGPGSGRIVSLNIFIPQGYRSGQAIEVTANAAIWASGAAPPEPLPMPITLEPLTHIYKDDHPNTITPIDTFGATIQVRDDDHMRVVPIGEVTTMVDQDFTGSFPPAGWTRSGTKGSNWMSNNFNNAGGTAPEAMFVWYQNYFSVGYGRLHTTVPVDTTGFGAIDITFKEYLNHFGGPYSLMVETSADGVNWDPVWTLNNPTSSHGPRTTTIAGVTQNIGIPTTYFSWTFYGDPYNLNYWFIDDLFSEAFDPYIMHGLGEDSVDIDIANVFPTLVVPPELVTVVDERVTFNFQSLEITDPAWPEIKTEDFWWRVNFDDSSPITSWQHVEAVIEGLDILFFHSLGDEGIGPLLDIVEPRILGLNPEATISEFDFLNDGTMTLEEMLEYDVVVIGLNWAGFDPNAVGDLVADYADAGGSVVESVASFHSTPGWWGLGGRWQSEGYSCLLPGGIGGTSYSTTIYDPSHPIIDGPAGTVSLFGTGIPISSPGETPGSTLLVDYPAYPAVAYNDESNPNPGTGRTVGLNVFYYPGYYYSDSIDLLLNSIMWAQEFRPRSKVLPTITHDFGDNGVYYVDYQFIDDDMYWDLSGAYPVYVGPAGEESSWISHNILPVEVSNVDPKIIRDINAYAELSLSLRQSGQKRNAAEMILTENGVQVGYAKVERDPGAPDIAVMDATVHMTKGYEYELIVNYLPEDGDGANPTWIFEGHFPDGKIKELKHTFNSNDPTDRTWNLGSVKALMLGHDIIFEAVAFDQGSDDLAFIWSFGDTSPHGVHLYENVNPTTTVEGTSDEATVLFNQIAGDPWFDFGPNTIRSPEINPITVQDTISHVFDESQPYYFYVHLTVLDDDVFEPYPSDSICPGSDSEFVEINFMP